MSRDDREEEPERRSLSCRMWSTSDRKTHPRGGNARMWSTSDQGGGTLRMWSTSKPKPTPTAEEYETYRQAAEAAENVRTGNWTAPWKDAPLPGTPEEARARQKRTRFRYHEQRDKSLKWTDTKARSAARKGGSRRSRRKTEANRAKGRYGILGARYGKLGGRPRKPRP
jgi:hypothetical protein